MRLLHGGVVAARLVAWGSHGRQFNVSYHMSLLACLYCPPLPAVRAAVARPASELSDPDCKVGVRLSRASCFQREMRLLLPPVPSWLR